MKRFWKRASVGDAAPHGVLLDGRPLRTPARAPLEVASRPLAEAIAAEWNAQGQEIDPRAMPLTGIANAAIDRVAPDAHPFADRLAAYAESELIAYRADAPAPLVARQAERWDPWLDWVRRRYDAHIAPTTGIMHRPQPPETLARLRAAFRALDPFTLAALDPVVTITGSAVLGLAVAAGALDAEEAYALGHLDAIWQEEQWGKDPLALPAEESRRRDLAAAVDFLSLCRQAATAT